MSQEVKQPVSVPGWVIMPYTYSVGPAASRFFVELRDNQRIMGIRCAKCNRVYVPPRSTCVKCFSKLEEWVELSSKGTLMSYTVIHYPLPIHPMETPFVYGIIQLDGADTGIVHLLGEFDFENLRIGMRVEAVFSEQPKGNILDIKYFRPIRA